MPIHGVPLLEYWLSALKFCKYGRVYVNSHFHAEIVAEYLSRKQFSSWVENLYERDLLGTAATIRKNKDIFANINDVGLVTSFEEKSVAPSSNLANGAVYFLSRELVDWICNEDSIKDFSIEVIPNFVGKIMTWHNTSYHRDIGSLEALKAAQKDPTRPIYWTKRDKWMNDFMRNPIHSKMKALL